MCEHRLPHEPSDQRVAWFSGSWPPTVDSSASACARRTHAPGPRSRVLTPALRLCWPVPSLCPPSPALPVLFLLLRGRWPSRLTPLSRGTFALRGSGLTCPVQTQRLSSCGRAGGRTPVPELLPTAPHSTEEPVGEHYPLRSRTRVDTPTASPRPSRMSGHAHFPSPPG